MLKNLQFWKWLRLIFLKIIITHINLAFCVSTGLHLHCQCCWLNFISYIYRNLLTTKENKEHRLIWSSPNDFAVTYSAFVVWRMYYKPANLFNWCICGDPWSGMWLLEQLGLMVPSLRWQRRDKLLVQKLERNGTWHCQIWLQRWIFRSFLMTPYSLLFWWQWLRGIRIVQSEIWELGWRGMHWG